MLVRDFRERGTAVKWTAGTLLQRIGSSVWSVKVQEQVWRRHTNQIKLRHWIDSTQPHAAHRNSDDETQLMAIPDNRSQTMSTSNDKTQTESKPDQPAQCTKHHPSKTPHPPPILRRSDRIRKPVRRLIEEI